MNTKLRKPNNKKPSGWKITLTVLLSLILIAALFTGGYILRSMFVKPQPGGDKDDETLYTGSETTAAAETEEDTPETNGDTAVGFKRREDVYNFLLIGKDEVATNTDVMIIASFDCTTGKISMCQMPRDTYAEYNDKYGKLNAAFASFLSKAKREKAEDPTKTALENLSDLFQKGLNIRLDYYMLINLKGFRAVVDRIGGVDMYVPNDMHYNDPEQNLSINIKKGQQTLMGREAEGFVRYRWGYIQADIARADAQKVFITAFIAKVKSSISIPMIAGLASDILPNLITNIKLEDCIYFAKQALKVDMSNITMLTMPGDSYKNGLYYVMHRADMLNIVNEYLNVYDKPIPSSYFDVDRIFVKDDNSEIIGYYNKKETEIVTHKADDVDKDGIYIALDPNKRP